MTGTPAFRSAAATVIGDRRRSQRYLALGLTFVLIATVLAVTLSPRPHESHLPNFAGATMLENGGGACSGASATNGSPVFLDWQTETITFGVAGLPCALGINGFPTKYIRAVSADGGTLLYTTGPAGHVARYNFLTDSGVLSSVTGFALTSGVQAATAELAGDNGVLVAQAEGEIDVLPIQHLSSVFSGGTFTPPRFTAVHGRLPLVQHGSKAAPTIAHGVVAVTSRSVCLATVNEGLLCQHHGWLRVLPSSLYVGTLGGKFVTVGSDGTTSRLSNALVPVRCSGSNLGRLTAAVPLEGVTRGIDLLVEQSNSRWSQLTVSERGSNCVAQVTQLTSQPVAPLGMTAVRTSAGIFSVEIRGPKSGTYLEVRTLLGNVPALPNFLQSTRALSGDFDVQVVANGGTVVVNPVMSANAWIITKSASAVRKNTESIANPTFAGAAGKHRTPPKQPRTSKAPPPPQEVVTKSPCSDAAVAAPSQLRTIGRPTTTSFEIGFVELAPAGICIPSHFSATIRDLTHGGTAGSTTCVAELTCTTSGLRSSTAYEVTIVGILDNGATTPPSTPFEISTSFGTLDSPMVVGAPSWSESKSQWAVHFAPGSSWAGSQVNVTVTATVCSANVLTTAGVAIPTSSAGWTATTTWTRGSGSAALTADQLGMSGLPIQLSLQAQVSKVVGGQDESATSPIVPAGSCELTPLNAACLSQSPVPLVAFNPTTGAAQTMTISLNRPSCHLGLFQPTFGYSVGQQPSSFPYACAQIIWEKEQNPSCSLVRANPAGVDPQSTQVWVGTTFVYPRSLQLPSGIDANFIVPEQRVGNAKAPFAWPSTAIPVTVGTTSSSAGGYNGWGTFTVAIGSASSPFWDSKTMQAPDLNYLKIIPSITCSGSSLTDVTTTLESSSSGVLQYMIREGNPSSSAQADTDLSLCTVGVQFSDVAKVQSLGTFTPTSDASISLYPSGEFAGGVAAPQSSWFSYCSFPDGSVAAVISSSASGCQGNAVAGSAGVNGGLAPGKFLSAGGCLGDPNAASDGVVFTCGAAVGYPGNPVTFLWEFAGRDYVVTLGSPSPPILQTA